MLKYILIILFTSSIIAANGKPTMIDKEIIELGLNYDFENAHKLLSETFKKDKNLKYYYLYLNVELLKSIQAAENIPFNEKQSFKDSLNQVLIDYTEKIIDKYEDQELSLDDKFYLGSIYGLLGRFYGVQKSWMSAFSSGKEGKNILEEVIEKDPNYVDAYLLLGMLNYYADRMGGVTEFIASILGLSGDRKVGLNYLQKVEKNGNLANWQATMILSELYDKMELNKFDALPLIQKFNKRFPNNTHFFNWYCYSLVELNMLDNISDMLNSLNINTLSEAIKASYFHKTGNYEKSNELYNNLLSINGNLYPWVFEKGKYQRVLNYLMLGNLNKAKKLSENLNELYGKRVQYFLNNPEMTKKLFEFRKEILLTKEDTISTELQNLDVGNSKFGNAFINFYLGIFNFQNNNFKIAEENFLKSKELDFENFGFNASNYLLQIYNKIRADKEKVENLISDIDDLDNEALELRAEDLEEKYNL